MKCTGKSGGVRTCKVGGRTFQLHPNKSNKAAKKRRGKALAKKWTCTRDRKTGQIKSCRLRRSGSSKKRKR
ncbi:MAG: hypothetical protein JSV86_05900 [Gemmatimonadota bacterium]|nr:MAG: hypothetical protein JSV86_05900 [Gemmatimonadota bacterium]